MRRYALLCGSAPLGFMQKKVDGMYDFLLSGEGGAWEEKDIMIFPNGIEQGQLSYVLERLRMQHIDHIFLYVCTCTPVYDYDSSFWLCGNEIEKSVADEASHVVFDADWELMSSGDYFYDEETAAEGWSQVIL